MVQVRSTELAVLQRNGGQKRTYHPDDPQWSVLVLLDGDDVVAIRNSCPHYGVDLISGYRRDGWIECPMHSWRIDVRTGRVMNHPTLCVQTFAVTVDADGVVYVDLPERSELAAAPTHTDEEQP